MKLRILKFLFIPLSCLFAVTSVTAYSLLKPLHQPVQVLTQQEFMPIFEPSRAIASIEPILPLAAIFQKEDKIKTKIHTTLTQSCEASVTLTQQVASDQVMIKSINCEKNLVAASSHLINSTNGYAAQLFKMKNSELSTDFIQLKKGENILKFEISLNDGQKKRRRSKSTASSKVRPASMPDGKLAIAKLEINFQTLLRKCRTLAEYGPDTKFGLRRSN